MPKLREQVKGAQESISGDREAVGGEVYIEQNHGYDKTVTF